MKLAEGRLAHRGQRGLRQERVLEPDKATLEREDALANRRLEDALRVDDACVRKRLEPRNGRGRCEKHGMARVVGQQPEALGGERREAVRNRQRLARADVLATPDERTPDLERVEGLPPEAVSMFIRTRRGNERPSRGSKSRCRTASERVRGGSARAIRSGNPAAGSTN